MMANNIYAEIERHCKGYARVNINNLEFHSARDLDDQNVDRLLGIFRLRGCQRDDPANAVPVVVEDQTLADISSALSQNPIGARTVPLSGTVKLQCLHGRHRISAARRFLPASDKWWTVKVFDHGTR
jgi:hypothetical protein